MQNLSMFIFYLYTWTPIVLVFASIIAMATGVVRKLRKKNYKKIMLASLILFIIAIMIFLIVPLTALIFGFGPGVSDGF